MYKTPVFVCMLKLPQTRQSAWGRFYAYCFIKPKIVSFNTLLAMLTEAQALEIYMFKISAMAKARSFGCADESTMMDLRTQARTLSKLYVVTPRTVRDIWRRRTWAYATCQLWSHEEENQSCLESVSEAASQVYEARF